MKYNNCFYGWEKYALDEKGKRYIKERYILPASGIYCNHLYKEIEEKSVTVYDIDKSKQKIALAKVYFEKGETIKFLEAKMKKIVKIPNSVKTE